MRVDFVLPDSDESLTTTNCQRLSRKTFSLLGGFLSLVIAVTPAHATDYYVAITGSDSNNGSQAAPWRNPQRCVDADSPLHAGDVCVVGDGTYTQSTVAGRVIGITSSSPKGTEGKPITIRSANRFGATIEVPNAWPGRNCQTEATICPFAGIYISSTSYYVIDGLKFTRPGSFYAAYAAVGGVTTFSAQNIVVRNSLFHDIGRNVCNEGVKGQTGIFADSSTNLLYENNIFNKIGRLRNGENGCVTEKFHHDHGIYLNQTSNVLIRNNIFSDVNRGFSINLKAYTGKTSHVKIFNNVFSGGAPSGNPCGQIAMTNILDDIQVKNNIFNDPACGFSIWWTTASATAGSGITLERNLTNSTRSEADFTQIYGRPSSVTLMGNVMNTNPAFVNAAGGDFHLTAGSPAIDKGLTLAEVPNDFDYGKRPFPTGGAADIGAFEFGAPPGTTPSSLFFPGTYNASSPPVFYSPTGEVCPSGY